MTKDETLKLALEALNTTESDCGGRAWEREQEAITAIKEALAQRTWVELTDDEILSISADCASSHQHTDIHFARAIEAKLRSKNSG
jgi:hypothetical protein